MTERCPGKKFPKVLAFFSPFTKKKNIFSDPSDGGQGDITQQKKPRRSKIDLQEEQWDVRDDLGCEDGQPEFSTSIVITVFWCVVHTSALGLV